MNELQKLLRVKNVSVLQLSEEIGVNYHQVQKVVKGTRVHRPTQEAIAEWCGLTADQVFGPRSARFLAPQIDRAIRVRADQVEERLRGRYLRSGNRLAEKKAAGNV